MQRMELIRWIFRAWRYRLRLEKQEIRIVLDHLMPGDTVIDVGAHKGGFTYWMLKQVGNDGHVVAFEPQAVLAERLRRLLEARGCPNAVVENQGLSSSTGVLTLNIPGPGTSPGASFEPHDDIDPPALSIPIPVTTLDQYSWEHNLGRIHMIKCDVEGHELEVFRGAEQLLASQHPLLIFECEVRHRRSGRVDDVFEFLHALGYRGWCLGPDGRFEVTEFDPRRHQVDPDMPDYINNFLFTVDSEHATS